MILIFLNCIYRVFVPKYHALLWTVSEKLVGKPRRRSVNNIESNARDHGLEKTWTE